MHSFKQSVAHIALPEKFTYPFHYTPHPLCVMAAEEVMAYLATRTEWHRELEAGKMFGVLVVKRRNESEGKADKAEKAEAEGKTEAVEKADKAEKTEAVEKTGTVDKAETQEDRQTSIGYLAAFSGNLAGKNLHAFFVPPVYDLLQPDGFFKREEEQISAINLRIREAEKGSRMAEAEGRWRDVTEEARTALAREKTRMKAAKEERERQRTASPSLSDEELAGLVRESQFQKAEYKRTERAWKLRIAEAEAELKALKTEVEELKKERRERSARLQRQLFEQFQLLNARGEVKDLCTIFEETVHKIPPAGTGECALPKLLQYAYLHHLQPLAMAEFWWGQSPKNEIRHHGYYYPSCKGKCEPILHHMLQGLAVDDNPLEKNVHGHTELETVYEDEWLVVVNKPAGMLSVPGKTEGLESVYDCMRKRYPQATGPLIVHRLDMATSGLLLIAKTKEVHQLLQKQFADRSIQKRYVAVLDGVLPGPNGSELLGPDDSCRPKTDGLGQPEERKKGRITLPLCLDPLNRPHQIVSEEFGKEALTEYEVLEKGDNYTRVAFYPFTGRTHQLRVHASHPRGLNCPIRGDELYGHAADRLYLHAEYLAFRHPVHGEWIAVMKEAPF